MFRPSLACNQGCRGQRAGEREPYGYPRHRAEADDECFLDGLTSARVVRFGRGQSGSLGLDLHPHRGGCVETVQSSVESALENTAEQGTEGCHGQ